MTSPIRLAQPGQPLHLYRHLLREASYLPTICRSFVSNRIKTQFRATREKLGFFNTSKVAWQPRKVSSKETWHRAKKAFQDGGRQLRALRAVNAGDLKRLRRMFLHAGGRLGKRRRELLANLVRPDAPADSAALEAHLKEMESIKVDGTSTSSDVGSRTMPLSAKLDERGRPMKPRAQDFWDTEKLLPIIRSQQQREARTTPDVWPKSEMPGNPERSIKHMGENIWGGPMPERRVRIKWKRWWKSAVDRIMPPVGKAEWDTIRKATRGELLDEQWKLRPRRPAAQPLLPSPELDTAPRWDWTTFASVPVARAERPKKGTNWRLSGEKDEGPYANTDHRQNLSSRQLRRSYGQLWQATPYFEQHPTTLKKNLHWGENPRASPPVASPSQSLLFRHAHHQTSRNSKSKRRSRSKGDEAADAAHFTS